MGQVFNLKNGTILLSTEAPGGLYSAAQLKKIASLCEEDMAIVKATEDQRLALFVKEDKAKQVAEALSQIGIGVRHYQDGLHQPVSCIGELCPEHQLDALGTAMDMTKALEKIKTTTSLKIGINGCGTCCVPCHTLDISIVADSNGYMMSLGGKNSQIPVLASFIAERIPYKLIVGLTEKIVAKYNELVDPNEPESLQDVIDRCGLSDFIAILDPYSQDAADDADPFGATNEEDKLSEDQDEEKSPEINEGDVMASEDLESLDEDGLELDDSSSMDDDEMKFDESDDLESKDPVIAGESSSDDEDIEGLDVTDLEESSSDPEVLVATDDDSLDDLDDVATHNESAELSDDVSLLADQSGDEELEEIPITEDAGEDGIEAEIPDETMDFKDEDTEIAIDETDPNLGEEPLALEPEIDEIELEEGSDLEPLVELDAKSDTDSEFSVDDSDLDSEFSEEEAEVNEDEFEQEIASGVEEDVEFRAHEEVDENASVRDNAINNLTDDNHEDSDISTYDEPIDVDDSELEKDLSDISLDDTEITDMPLDLQEETLMKEGTVPLPVSPVARIDRKLTPAHSGSNGASINFKGFEINASGQVILNFDSGHELIISQSKISGPRSLSFCGQDIHLSPSPSGLMVGVDGLEFFIPLNIRSAS